jgi:DNA-directed RNA polymerase subunit RPC12/RpoP
MKCKECGKEVPEEKINKILKDLPLEISKDLLNVWCKECKSNK